MCRKQIEESSITKRLYKGLENDKSEVEMKETKAHEECEHEIFGGNEEDCKKSVSEINHS